MPLPLLAAALAAPLLVAYVVACFRDPLRYALAALLRRSSRSAR